MLQRLLQRMAKVEDSISQAAINKNALSKFEGNWKIRVQWLGTLQKGIQLQKREIFVAAVKLFPVYFRYSVLMFIKTLEGTSMSTEGAQLRRAYRKRLSEIHYHKGRTLATARRSIKTMVFWDTRVRFSHSINTETVGISQMRDFCMTAHFPF